MANATTSFPAEILPLVLFIRLEKPTFKEPEIKTSPIDSNIEPLLKVSFKVLEPVIAPLPPNFGIKLATSLLINIEPAVPWAPEPPTAPWAPWFPWLPCAPLSPCSPLFPLCPLSPV